MTLKKFNVENLPMNRVIPWQGCCQLSDRRIGVLGNNSSFLCFFDAWRIPMLSMLLWRGRVMCFSAFLARIRWVYACVQVWSPQGVTYLLIFFGVDVIDISGQMEWGFSKSDHP